MEADLQEINGPASEDKNLLLPSTGDVVELRREGTLLRIGAVETVMPDGTGFWLASHGLDTRIYVSSSQNELEIHIRPVPEQTQTAPASSGLTGLPL